ncbi:hypothetical protein M422DRAFT_47792 [Sphaerobolus stellatus SS14]|uniref:Uncharacterized protein n=1 Tax=Sphaerobolus stellatus (strain SS14) TaxID=990650 RepID=A0A0C9UL14_SPHS4|nr:hypothetical protein M422DRAFT_47792 [Sphaerobolus stellatus SS14]
MEYEPSIASIDLDSDPPSPTIPPLVRSYFADKLTSHLWCNIPYHELCVVNKYAGTHYPVSNKEYEKWITALCEGETTITNPPFDISDAMTIADSEAAEVSTIRSASSYRSKTISSGVVGPGYLSGKALKWLGQQSLRAMSSQIRFLNRLSSYEEAIQSMASTTALLPPERIDKVYDMALDSIFAFINWHTISLKIMFRPRRSSYLRRRTCSVLSDIRKLLSGSATSLDSYRHRIILGLCEVYSSYSHSLEHAWSQVIAIVENGDDTSAPMSLDILLLKTICGLIYIDRSRKDGPQHYFEEFLHHAHFIVFNSGDDKWASESSLRLLSCTFQDRYFNGNSETSESLLQPWFLEAQIYMKAKDYDTGYSEALSCLNSHKTSKWLQHLSQYSRHIGRKISEPDDSYQETVLGTPGISGLLNYILKNQVLDSDPQFILDYLKPLWKIVNVLSHSGVKLANRLIELCIKTMLDIAKPFLDFWNKHGEEIIGIAINILRMLLLSSPRNDPESLSKELRHEIEYLHDTMIDRRFHPLGWIQILSRILKTTDPKSQMDHYGEEMSSINY